MATTAVSVGTMKVAQISKAAGDFELVERDIPEPGPRAGAGKSGSLRDLP